MDFFGGNDVTISKPALKAMHRATNQALEKTAIMNLKIPEWRDGKIVFVDPGEKLKKPGFIGTQRQCFTDWDN